jgi:sugar phosphate isomerase/epimerase
MKFSIVLSTQPTSFSALAYKGKIEENIIKIKKYGYDAVELAVRDPNQLEVNSLTQILVSNKLPVSAIGTGQAFGEEGLSFTNSNKEIRRKAIDRIKSQINLAEKLNSIVIIGLIRGKKEVEQKFTEVENYFLDAIRECASENEKIKLVIEPINRYETNLINTVTQGLEFLEKAGCSNVGLLLDTFHMNIEEKSLTESIIIAREKLFHFHVADSNRWHPGAGHIDFNEVLNTLRGINYTGYVSAEILPLPDPDSSAKNTISYLRNICKNNK